VAIARETKSRVHPLDNIRRWQNPNSPSHSHKDKLNTLRCAWQKAISQRDDKGNMKNKKQRKKK